MNFLAEFIWDIYIYIFLPFVLIVCGAGAYQLCCRLKAEKRKLASKSAPYKIHPCYILAEAIATRLPAEWKPKIRFGISRTTGDYYAEVKFYPSEENILYYEIECHSLGSGDVDVFISLSGIYASIYKSEFWPFSFNQTIKEIVMKVTNFLLSDTKE